MTFFIVKVHGNLSLSNIKKIVQIAHLKTIFGRFGLCINRYLIYLILPEMHQKQDFITLSQRVMRA